MQSESLIYAFISMGTNLSWLFPGLFITWLYLRRVGMGAIFSQSKSCHRSVFQGQSLGQENYMLLSPGCKSQTIHSAQSWQMPSTQYFLQSCDCGDNVNPKNSSHLSPCGTAHHVWFS